MIHGVKAVYQIRQFKTTNSLTLNLKFLWWTRILYGGRPTKNLRRVKTPLFLRRVRWRGSQVVRRGSAKALCVGSIPTLASNLQPLQIKDLRDLPISQRPIAGKTASKPAFGCQNAYCSPYLSHSNPQPRTRTWAWVLPDRDNAFARKPVAPGAHGCNT